MNHTDLDVSFKHTYLPVHIILIFLCSAIGYLLFFVPTQSVVDASNASEEDSADDVPMVNVKKEGENLNMAHGESYSFERMLSW